MYFFFILLFSFILKLIMNYKYFMIILMMIEFISLVFILMIQYYFLNLNMNIFFLIFFLIFCVIEGIIGLSLMISIIQNYFSMNFQLINLLW